MLQYICMLHTKLILSCYESRAVVAKGRHQINHITSAREKYYNGHKCTCFCKRIVDDYIVDQLGIRVTIKQKISGKHGEDVDLLQ